MQPFQICIGPIIRIGRESWCLPYAGFFLMKLVRKKKEKTKSLKQFFSYLNNSFVKLLYCIFNLYERNLYLQKCINTHKHQSTSVTT